jgi:hypothetical protein
MDDSKTSTTHYIQRVHEHGALLVRVKMKVARRVRVKMMVKRRVRVRVRSSENERPPYIEGV